MDKKFFLVLCCSVLNLVPGFLVAQQAKITSGDSVTVAASKKYKHPSFLHRFLMGKNYRREWSTPVTIPLFHIKRTTFVIDELGGGMQTKSLHLIDGNDREWVLRSVDKDAGGAIPKFLNNTIVEDVVQDMISAAHPYGALVVGYLAKAEKIVAPDPTLYFIPDDPALKEYRSIFANTVCMLERHEPTPDKTDAEKTEKVLEEIQKENDHLILQQTVLKARLLDMLIADWDRHADQWRWGMKKSGNLLYYYAIPRDRDQAFFMSKGLLPKIAKLIAMPYINQFKYKCSGFKNLNYKARSLDRAFLNELDAAIWEKICTDFTNLLPDNVIAAAVKQMPKEIVAIDSTLLVSKLISRRNCLKEGAMKYYRFLSRVVQIKGTEEAELFKISPADNGRITVSVNRLNRDKTPGQKIYERTFTENETSFIYLIGEQGDDQFIIDKNVSSKIKIKIFGGQGRDTFDIKGSIRNSVYDKRSDENLLINLSHSKTHIH